MIVAYLVNQYPHVSHTFIRREIAALEARGLAVKRFSVRPAPKELVDPADLAESPKTHVILKDGAFRIVMSVFITMFANPVSWTKSLATAVKLGWRSQRGVLRHLIYFAEACHLYMLLKEVAATHLHAHFGTNPATVALLTRLLGGPPYSFTVHGPEEFDQPQSLGLRDKIQHAKFVAAISSFGRSQLCRWCPHDQWAKLRVIRCGLDADFLGNTPTPVPDVPRFVCVGRLGEQKGQLVLLEAAAMVREEVPNLEVVLAGDGPMRPIIERRIAELNLQSNVRITGWVSNEQVRELIRDSRAMVLPSFAEGLPVVLMESLALGRPAISTYVAGIPELIRQGENGRLVVAGSAEQLAVAMWDVLKVPVERLTQMGIAGAEIVHDRHDAAKEAGRLAEAFAEP